MQAVIKAIEYYLPDQVLTNEQLAVDFPEWSVKKIGEKIGISERHIADEKECSSDLAVLAAQKLFDSQVCHPDEIDYILLCTQSPDFFLPTTACLVQDRLRIPTTAGALDFNLGCSGFVYGLGLAKGLIETGQARNLLLITAETYSKFIHPADKGGRTIFGDAAAATLMKGFDPDVNSKEPPLGPFIFGTDGSGASNLIVPVGGMRYRSPHSYEQTKLDEHSNRQTGQNLYMNGSEIFTFTLRAVPQVVQQLLLQTGKSIEEIDLFVFHQANRYMLDHLRKKLNIPREKFYIAMESYGNTVSATIPIALKCAMEESVLQSGHQVMLVGFGVGYSWGATLLRWTV